MKPCKAIIYYAGKPLFTVIGYHTETQDELMARVQAKIAVTVTPQEKDEENEND